MEQIIQLINEQYSFVLVGHTGPDGDTIGSCYGLAFALEQLGKNVSVVLEPYSQKYNIIPGHKFLHTGLLDELDVNVLIALDSADVGRLGSGLSLFARAKHTVCIDHHKTNIGFANINHIEPETSSTSEIIFRLIEKLVEPTVEIAAAIYAGMVCDTGGFKYNSTTKSTMDIAARLMGIGIPFTEIYNEVLHSHTFAAGRAKGIVMQNAKQTLDGRITFSHISHKDLVSVGADISDLDGVVEYLLSTRGTDVAAFVYEKQNSVIKISFRSQGPDVSAVAAEMGGGGHTLAAASSLTGDIETVTVRALQLLEKEIVEYDRHS